MLPGVSPACGDAKEGWTQPKSHVKNCKWSALAKGSPVLFSNCKVTLSGPVCLRIPPERELVSLELGSTHSSPTTIVSGS